MKADKTLLRTAKQLAYLRKLKREAEELKLKIQKLNLTDQQADKVKAMLENILSPETKEQQKGESHES